MSKEEKTKYSDEELKEFTELIEKKLVEAKEKLAFFTSQINGGIYDADIKMKSIDDGVVALEKEKNMQHAARQQKYINHLKNAQIRIKNGVYGICRVTGKLISKERLRAVPHATLSIEAKEQMDK